MLKFLILTLLAISSSQIYAQNAYSDITKKIMGKWYFGDEKGCSDSRSADEGVFYSINSKGKIVSEVKNKDSITVSSGLIKEIELSDKSKYQYIFISDNKDFSSGKVVIKKTLLQFDPDFNSMTIIDQDVDGEQVIKNNIKLSTNTPEGIAGFKCTKNLSTPKNTQSSNSAKDTSNAFPETEQEIRQRMYANEAIIKNNKIPAKWDDRKQEWIWSPEMQLAMNEQEILNRKLNKVLDEKRAVQQAQDESKRKVEREKDAAAAQIANNIQNQKLNDCLNSGKISICSFSAQSPKYKCGRVYQNTLLFGYQWVDQFCDDNSKFQVSFKSKNNLSSSVKDITYRCESIAKSGTVLGSNDNQIYDLWSPGDVKNITMTIPRISQTDSLNCFAKSWK